MNIENMKNKGKRALSPLKSIKNYCKYHCCVGDRKSWVHCNVPNCYLFSYRLGRKPLPVQETQKNIEDTHKDFDKNEVLEDTQEQL